jgi:hypothetical protein
MRLKGDSDMKKVWKWIIGIVIGLVVVGLLVAGAFYVVPRMMAVRAVRENAQSVVQVPGKGNVPFGDNGEGQRGWQGGDQGRMPGGMMPFGRNGWGEGGWQMRGPGMMGHGGMMPFGGLIVGLFFLGFLALGVLGIIWLVRRTSKPVAVPVPAVVATHPCKKCGQPLQEDWKNCPYCGKKV